MIITINISKEEVRAIKRNDPRSLSILSELFRFVIRQTTLAEDMDGRDEFNSYTIISPPIPLVENIVNRNALCLPLSEEIASPNAKPEIKTDIPDVFKRMQWTEEAGTEEE